MSDQTWVNSGNIKKFYLWGICLVGDEKNQAESYHILLFPEKKHFHEPCMQENVTKRYEFFPMTQNVC